MPPDSRWKAPRSRGTQKNDKKGSGAPVGASEPLFMIGAVTAKQPVLRSSPFRENGTAERPQTLRCPKIINVFPLKMPSNDDDRRQWRKQGGVVGAAASKTQVPPKARCGCWVPQPVRRGGHSNRYTPPKGAQDHIRSISASTSSMRVAQLVAMRTTVWVSSNFSQKPNFALPSSAASWAFSSTRKIWFVGESIKKR